MTVAERREYCVCGHHIWDHETFDDFSPGAECGRCGGCMEFRSEASIQTVGDGEFDQSPQASPEAGAS